MRGKRSSDDLCRALYRMHDTGTSNRGIEQITLILRKTVSGNCEFGMNFMDVFMFMLLSIILVFLYYSK